MQNEPVPEEGKNVFSLTSTIGLTRSKTDEVELRKLDTMSILQIDVGCGCTFGSGGRAVASVTWEMRFESGHWQIYLSMICINKCIEK